MCTDALTLPLDLGAQPRNVDILGPLTCAVPCTPGSADVYYIPKAVRPRSGCLSSLFMRAVVKGGYKADSERWCCEAWQRRHGVQVPERFKRTW